MAYISKEEVKEMRVAIKEMFPAKSGWKFSITRSHSSSINVTIKEAPIDLDPCNKGNFQVNQYYIDEHYEDYPILRDVLNSIKNCITNRKDHYDRNAGDMGADYGDCTYFYNISVGSWKNDFILV